MCCGILDQNICLTQTFLEGVVIELALASRSLYIAKEGCSLFIGSFYHFLLISKYFKEWPMYKTSDFEKSK